MTAKKDSEGKKILTAFEKGMAGIIITFLSAIVWLCYVNTGRIEGHEVAIVNHAKQIENNTRGIEELNTAKIANVEWKFDIGSKMLVFQTENEIKFDSILKYLKRQDKLLKRICEKINIPNTYNDILGSKKDSTNLITIKN